MQKTLVSFLLTLLIIQWTALPLLWQWRLADVHYEAGKEGMEGELQSLTISGKEWEQSRTGKKEIRLAGNMYDIKSIQLEGDSVHLTVKRDYKEERLLKTGEQITGHHSTEHRDGSIGSTDIFYTVYLVPEHPVPFIAGNPVFQPAFAEIPAPFKGRSPGCPDQPPQLF